MSYPEALVRIFGKDNLFFKQGKDFHRYMRQIALQLLGPECLKKRFIHKIDLATGEHLKSDSSQVIFRRQRYYWKSIITSPELIKNQQKCYSLLCFDWVIVLLQLILEQMIQRIISDIKPENKSKLIEKFRDFSFDLVRSPFDPSLHWSYGKISCPLIFHLNDLLAY